MVHLDLNISFKTELRLSTQKSRTESLLIKINAYIIGIWTGIKNVSKKKSRAHVLYSDILVQSFMSITSYVLLLLQPDLSPTMAMKNNIPPK